MKFFRPIDFHQGPDGALYVLNAAAQYNTNFNTGLARIDYVGPKCDVPLSVQEQIFASYVDKSLSLPMIYIRKAKKDHGIASLIEGTLPKDSKVLLVEDLITDAGSKLHFIDAIRSSGAIVENVLVLFDREQGGKDTLKKHKLKLYAATDMSTVLAVAKSAKLFSKTLLQSVCEYLDHPNEWHKKKGLKFKQ